MRSHIHWRGKRIIPYKDVETSSLQTCTKTMKLMAIHKWTKRTMSTSGGLGLGPAQLDKLKTTEVLVENNMQHPNLYN